MNDLEQLAYIKMVDNWLNNKIHGYSVDEIISMIYKCIFPTANSDGGMEPSRFYIEHIVNEINDYYIYKDYDYDNWNNVVFPLLQNSLLYTAFNGKQ